MTTPAAIAQGPPPKYPLSLPGDSVFSFKAPLPPTLSPTSSKQRRVSLALPNSPRVVPAWSFRDDTGVGSHVAETETSHILPERKGKMRKISKDDGEEFGSEVGMAEKKLRKKWTPEETQTLVKGCNLHGVGNWKAILSDPNLHFDNRSPVDLKDRFRTYFPDAYKQHYPNAKTHLSSKIRSTLPDGSSLFEKTRSKKRRPFTEEEDRALRAGYEKHGTVWAAIVKDPIFQNRRSTDLRDRFRNAFPELYQAAGYKPRNSVATKKMKARAEVVKPVTRAATDDQLSMSSTATRSRPPRRRANTNQGLLRGGTKSVPQSAECSEDEDSSGDDEELMPPPRLTKSISFTTSSPEEQVSSPVVDMNAFPDFTSPSYDKDGMSWSSAVDTPVHSQHAWSATAASPTSSHLSSDYLLNHSSAPSPLRGVGMGMIGKSAWGTQDWFSANPRLDSSSSSLGTGASGASTSSLFDDGLPPASPYSFNSLSHGVFDRYDLFPTAAFASYGHTGDFSSVSEAGVGDTHSTFSDEMFSHGNNFRGFTHHSNSAGDLIFGTRTHQPQMSMSFGIGGGYGGLGLMGIPQSTGIHPMQLHTPALPGIDEIELASITLNDQVDASPQADSSMVGTSANSSSTSLEAQNRASKAEPADVLMPMSSSADYLQNMEDLVDFTNEMHSTPPATPVTSRPRPLRKLSASASTIGVPSQYYTSGRSISVPPSEDRASSRPQQVHAASQPSASYPMRSPPFFASLSSGSNDSTTLMHSRPDLQNHQFAHHHQPHALQHSQSHHDLPPSAHSQPSIGILSTTAMEPMIRLSNEIYDLPFLDLHYYGHGAGGSPSGGANLLFPDYSYGGDSNNSGGMPYRQGQDALDLASIHTPSTAVMRKPRTPPPPPSSFKPSASTASRSGLHQRGQSAVTPQDLLVRRKTDNKRKRASWDGGAA